MKVVIAGGSGFLGSGLGASFRNDGHQVRVLTRRPGTAEDVAWDPSAPPGEWTSSIDGADAVINLAGAPIAAKRWTPARKSLIRESRMTATRALVASIANATRPPSVLVNASAVGIYGTDRLESLTEDSSPGNDFLASVCVAWEAEARQASSITRVVMLRTGLVLDRAGGALPPMARPIAFFVGGRLGSGNQYYSWIHRDDWTRMVRWVVENPAVTGPLNLTAPAPVTNGAFTNALARVLRRPALVPAPAFALRLLLGEMADALILGGQRVLPEKAARYGFTFRFADVESALRAIYQRA